MSQKSNFNNLMKRLKVLLYTLNDYLRLKNSSIESTMIKNFDLLIVFIILSLSINTSCKELDSHDDLLDENEINCLGLNNWEQVDFTKSHEELFYVRYPLNSDGTINKEVIKKIVSDLDAANYGMNWISTDYNNDGLMDLVGQSFTWEGTVVREDGYKGYDRKTPIKFFKGKCDGTFEEDKVNSGKFLGLVHPRKLLQGDFNKDGFVDFFFVGHGYDVHPFPFEFPKSLISDGKGGFTEHDYVTEVSFFHGGTTGDFNNDGWLDVFLVDAGNGRSAIYLNNNGVLTPRRDLINQLNTGGKFNVGWHDINDDGKLDLLLGGHDWNEKGEYPYTPTIIFGNGQDFLGEKDVLLPPTKLQSQGIMTDSKIFDIDGDGNKEIILARTGDNAIDPDNFYASWSLQILKINSDGSYTDRTTEYIENYHGSLKRVGHDGPYWIDTWIPWLLIKNEGGLIKLSNSEAPSSPTYKEWILRDGFFHRNK